jgi:hypothetical protein
MLENLIHRHGTVEARASDALQGFGKLINISNIMQLIKLATKLRSNISQPSANTAMKVKRITDDKKLENVLIKTCNTNRERR